MNDPRLMEEKKAIESVCILEHFYCDSKLLNAVHYVGCYKR